MIAYITLFIKENPSLEIMNNKVLYCMVKGDHVYTLNHDLKTLEHKYNASENKIIVKASSNYRIQDEEEVKTYKIIDNIDDILKIMKEYKFDEAKKEHKIYLIHRSNDLTALYYEFRCLGYEPRPTFECGIISFLFIELNRIHITIRTQELITSSIQRSIVVDSEEVYNKMSRAMSHFHIKY
jgi:hypothetical protein